MAEIKKANGRNIIDYMARDYDSFLESMRGLIPDKLPEWKDYKSEADFGNVLLQLFAHSADILSYYQDRVANESFLGTAQTRRSIIHHLRLIGYRLSTAFPASTQLTITVPESCEDKVTINRGDAFATESDESKASVRFEYNLESPLTIDFGAIGAVKGEKHYSGIPVEEGRLIQNEILGTSDSKANQTFPLAHSGLILRSLGPVGQKANRDIILITELGSLVEEWTLQESLAFSREKQRDFTIDIDEEDRATVTFGDGIFGAILGTGAIIKATYRVGGGSHGNVRRDSIQIIVDAPQLALLGAEVTNPEPASGGADRESIEHAVMHAPSVFRSLKRAVTAEDYKALALDFKGVGKVRAEARNWNNVDLFVAPEGGGHVSDVLRANLLAYFEDKRQVSTIIEIRDVDYVKVYVAAEVKVKSYYDPKEVREQVKGAAGSLLAFDNVDFGKTIYLSKFYEAIEAIEGVEYVNITEFRRQDSPAGYLESDGRIDLDINEIPKAPDDPEDALEYDGGVKVVILVGGI